MYSFFQELLKRQNTFRPVFGALLRATRNERQKAISLRRLLVDNNVDYEKLNAAYQEEASEGLEKLLKSEVSIYVISFSGQNTKYRVSHLEINGLCRFITSIFTYSIIFSLKFLRLNKAVTIDI